MVRVVLVYLIIMINKIKLGVILAVISTIVLFLAWGCYESVEAPFACIPLVLIPSGPYMLLASILGIPYESPIDWVSIIAGSAAIWFVFGFLIQLVRSRVSKDKTI